MPAMIGYGLNVLALSIIISLFTAALADFALSGDDRRFAVGIGLRSMG